MPNGNIAQYQNKLYTQAHKRHKANVAMNLRKMYKFSSSAQGTRRLVFRYLIF